MTNVVHAFIKQNVYREDGVQPHIKLLTNRIKSAMNKQSKMESVHKDLKFGLFSTTEYIATIQVQNFFMKTELCIPVW